MHKQGMFTPGHPVELVLSDHAWLSAKEIQENRYDYRPSTIIPFAITGRACMWAWYQAWMVDGQFEVIFCPDDCDTGKGFAPSFEGCVYRLLLEELAQSWLCERLSIDPAQLASRLKHSVESLQGLLRPAWHASLIDLVSRPMAPHSDGGHCCASQDEVDGIVRRDLSFGHVDEEVYLMKE